MFPFRHSASVAFRHAAAAAGARNVIKKSKKSAPPISTPSTTPDSFSSSSDSEKTQVPNETQKPSNLDKTFDYMGRAALISLASEYILHARGAYTDYKEKGFDEVMKGILSKTSPINADMQRVLKLLEELTKQSEKRHHLIVEKLDSIVGKLDSAAAGKGGGSSKKGEDSAGSEGEKEKEKGDGEKEDSGSAKGEENVGENIPEDSSGSSTGSIFDDFF